MDSVAGKLGATQGEESPAWMALRDKQQLDGAFLEDVVNDILVPKLIKLGFRDAEQLLKYRFCFSNTHEVVEARAREDEMNLKTAQIAQTMKNAGLKMDAAYFEERTGIKVTEITEPEPVNEPAFNQRVQNRLKELYK